MLDINYYRFAEEKAKNGLSTWLISKRYNLEIFEKEGFPTRLNNVQQLKQIFNTMQEDRFDIYMQELDGLNDDELEFFMEALKKSIEFQRIYFPKKDLILPLDTLMAFFIIFNKIYKLNPNAQSILEIGPGSGFSPFFLGQFKSLEKYIYTDACESFYMLQNYINSFMFGINFKQHAIEKESNCCYIPEEALPVSQGGIEKDIVVECVSKASFCSNAYPWWKLNDIAKDTTQYELVTSNANLLEMSEGALNDYLSIIKKKISQSGIFFVHCPGYDLVRGFDYLVDKLYEFNFAIVFYAKWTHEYSQGDSGEIVKKRFKVPNMVIVNDKHYLYEKFKNKPNLENLLLLSGDSSIDNVFFQKKIKIK